MIMTALERLEAVEAIRVLKARYFLHLDRKQWDAWRTLFTDDAVLDASSEFPDAPDPSAHRLVGAGTIVAGVSRFVRAMVTVHHGFTPIILIEDVANASAIWAFEDRLVRPDGSGIHGFGHYHERYRNAPDGWKIAETIVHRLRVTPIPASAGQ